MPKFRMQRIIATFFVMLMLFACDLTQLTSTTASKPTASIGSPPHGATLPTGQEVLVQSNAIDTNGIARIELWADGVLVTVAQPPTVQPQFAAILRWTPTTTGAHTLVVKAINAQSATSDPAAVSVNVTAPAAVAPTLPPTQAFAPTQSPTQALVPALPAAVQPTLTSARPPTITPTQPPLAQAAYSPLTFSSALNEDTQTPINPGKIFPFGTMIVYAYWTYSGVAADTPFEYEWFWNDTRIDSNGENFIKTAGKSFQWIINPMAPNSPKLPLDPGTYRYVVRVRGTVILSDTMVIQMPTNTVSVFFTVSGGSPTAYVIDKQGGKHTPKGYATISDIHVAAGDRVVLYTDQARFSLLFDCGTSPQIYSPCDFVADTPAKLPAEIRKNVGGASAYINISRADNWAGIRSNFPTQRYPADPVFRIGLGD